jgi:hypothetical protein
MEGINNINNINNGDVLTAGFEDGVECVYLYTGADGTINNSAQKLTVWYGIDAATFNWCKRVTVSANPRIVLAVVRVANGKYKVVGRKLVGPGETWAEKTLLLRGEVSLGVVSLGVVFPREAQ